MLSIQMELAVSTFTSTTASDWYNQQKLGLTKGADISWNTIAENLVLLNMQSQEILRMMKCTLWL